MSTINKRLIGISSKMGGGKDTFFDRLVLKTNTSWQNRKFSTGVKEVAGLVMGVDPNKFEEQEFKASIQEQYRKFDVVTPYGTVSFNSLEEANEYSKKYTSTKCEVKENVPTVRDILQVIGTDMFRDKLHPDVWCMKLFNSYEKNEHWVITDVRFKNEADYIKKEGGILIRINRPIHDRIPEYMLDDYPYENSDDNSVMRHLRIRYRDMYERLRHISEISLDHYNNFDYIINNTSTLDHYYDQIDNFIKKFEL